VIGKAVSKEGKIKTSPGLKKLNRLTKTLEKMP
jgi:hypothetical protein